MSPDRMSATGVAHKSTGGTLQSLPEPVDPVGDAPDYLTFKTVAERGHSVVHAARCNLARSRHRATQFDEAPDSVAQLRDGLTDDLHHAA